MGDYQHSQVIDAPADQLFEEGPDKHHGSLDVEGDETGSSVSVFLHTERHDSGEIDQGITDTLAAVKRLVEVGPAPGPA